MGKMGLGSMGPLAFWGLLVLAQSVSLAQEGAVPERLAEYLQGPSGGADLLADLEYLLDQPVDPNRAETDELLAVPFLRADVVDSILAYRGRGKEIQSLDELIKRGWLTEDELDRVRPFLIVRRERKGPGGIRLRYRSAAKPGVTSGLYSRFFWLPTRNLSLALITERDVGETRLDDFRSLSLWWTPRPGLQIGLGDYRISFGQGLLFSAPYAPRPGPDFASLWRRNHEPAPYLAATEMWPLRGIAMHARSPSLDLTAFASQLRRDGSLDPLTHFPVWDLDGYHRSAAEKGRRAALQETVVGGQLRIRTGILRSFAFAAAYQAVRDVRTSAPDGADILGLGVNWSRRVPGGVCFGELARTGDDAMAALVGLYFASRKHQTVVAGYFHSGAQARWFRSNSFALADETGGRGICLGQSWTVRRGQMGWYLLLRQPSLRNMPSYPASEKLWFAEVPLRKGIRFELRIQDRRRTKRVAVSDSAGRVHERSQEDVRRALRLELEASQGRLSCRLRLEPVWLGAMGGRDPEGFLVAQQWRLHLIRGLEVLLRVCRFDVREPSATLYVYEPDLPGAFSMRSFGRRGEQIVSLVQLQRGRWLASLKYAWIQYDPGGSVERSVGVQVDRRI
ncbi:MAG: helix-hairpin-helix domain-containing protein [candidate division KSB1 bacterium]|nr:helix-hairpin-helix domain-containing protein [candidate division KSB1 bacterium]